MSSRSWTASDRMMEISTSSRATAAPPPGSGSKCPGMESFRCLAVCWAASRRSTGVDGPPGCVRRSDGLLAVLLERGPQAVAVHGLHVALHLLAGAAGDDRPALVMDVEHELGGLVLGVAEVR